MNSPRVPSCSPSLGVRIRAMSMSVLAIASICKLSASVTRSPVDPPQLPVERVLSESRVLPPAILEEANHGRVNILDGAGRAPGRSTRAQAGDGAPTAAVVHRGRHLGHRHLRRDRQRGQTSRWGGLAALPGRVHRGDDHRLLLPGTGHQVPAGRRRRAVHPQGVRRALLHLLGLLHRDVLRYHLGLHRLAGLRRQLRRLHRSGAAGRAPISTSAPV